ncbi:MAG TPA: DUF4197 domain-containing protein [Steroidobacter sp.]|nr:DUF4197 domain-containing protein [Steroidobacter sp.]
MGKSMVSGLQLRRFRAGLLILTTLGLGGCSEMSQILQASAEAAGQSNESSLAQAVKNSLELGNIRAADALSQPGGYSKHSAYRIRLPDPVQPLATRLRQFGLGGQVDRIESLMNQGAEQAATEAKPVFIDAIRAMTITNALGIVRGHDTAATEYFRGQTELSLRKRYLPIIQRNLRQLGFYQQYQQLLTTYKQLPLSNKPDLDLEQHVLTRSLDALFRQAAEEEKLIRKDPVGRGSAAIARVFGGY